MHFLLYILYSVSLLIVTTTSITASDDRQSAAQGRPTDPYQCGWAATYGGADEDWASSIQQTREGGYIVAGLAYSFGVGKRSLWVLKLRPDGYICPSCDVVFDIIALKTRSNATILDTRASVKDSHANPLDSSAVIMDTYAQAEIQCPVAPYYYGKPTQFQPHNIPQKTPYP